MSGRSLEKRHFAKESSDRHVSCACPSYQSCLYFLLVFPNYPLLDMLPNFVVGAANVSNHPNVPRVSVIIHFANVFKCFTVPIVGNVSNVDCMRRNLLSHRGVAAGLNFPVKGASFGQYYPLLKFFSDEDGPRKGQVAVLRILD